MVDECIDVWIQGLETGCGNCPGRSAFPEGATWPSKMFVSGMEDKSSPHCCSMVCLRLQALPLKLVLVTRSVMDSDGRLVLIGC